MKLIIQDWQDESCTKPLNCAAYYERGGGWSSLRHMRVGLRWRWRRHTRPRPYLNSKQFDEIENGLRLIERNDDGIVFRVQTIRWTP